MDQVESEAELAARRSGWTVQTGAWQPRRPAFWAFAALLLLCALPLVDEISRLLAERPLEVVASVLLLVPYGLPLAFLVHRLDVYEREPLSIMVAAVLWGALAAVGIALAFNGLGLDLLLELTGDPDFVGAWGPALTVPLVEEGAKLLGLLLLVRLARRELDDVLDGFVWGAMVGVGFLLVEDVLYFVQGYIEAGGYGGLLELFVIRVLASGLYSHFLYSGLVGMGVAWWLVRRHEPLVRRALASGGLVLAGVLAHTAWNSPLLEGLLEYGIWPYAAVKGLPLLAGLVVLVRLQLLREQRWFEHLAEGFVADGTITRADLDALASLPARRRARMAAEAAGGGLAGRLMGDLQRQQLHLAMLHARLGDAAHEDVVRQRALVRATRGRLAEAIAAGPDAGLRDEPPAG